MSGRKRLGKRLVDALADGIRAIEAGRPLRQTIVRRMKVKGRDVWAREVFDAPLTPDAHPRDGGRGEG